MFVLLSIGSAVGWMYFQHIPGWYRPVWLTRAQAELVRDQLQQTFEIASEKMVAGKAFSITFSAQQINEMLSAQQIIWPAATAWMDPRWSAPCVDIQSEHIKVGLRCRWGQIQSVLNVQLAARDQNNELAINVLSVKAGSLPVPTPVVSRRYFGWQNSSDAAVRATAQRPPDATDPLAEALDKLLFEGRPLSLADTFWWPNGDIPFKISAIAFESGSVTIRVLPLLN